MITDEKILFTIWCQLAIQLAIIIYLWKQVKKALKPLHRVSAYDALVDDEYKKEMMCKQNNEQ